jgi:NtrC-family two-component system response regulator AlgB
MAWVAMTGILVVDDDAAIRRALEIQLRGDGHSVRSAASGEAALDLLDDQASTVVLLDLRLPGMSGEETLEQIRTRHPKTHVVIITAHGSIDSAVQAIKAGAYDYLTKPFTPDEVRVRIRHIEELESLRGEVSSMRRRMGELPFGDEFLTQSPETLGVLETGERVAATDATILLSGESGTGKSLLARLIHGASARRDGPFVTVDFGSIHETLLESELFGVRQGAFTGAVRDAAGKVTAAEGGTLFLDEVGELPVHLQSRLLRLVESRTYERVGEARERSADVRIIAATNRDLEEMVSAGDFRSDLFYRLSVVEIALPSLRSRPEDVLLLAGRIFEGLREVHGRTLDGWTEEVGRMLVRYPWPGNVRELAHVIERALLVSSGPTITRADLPERLAKAAPGETETNGLEPLAVVEERHLRRALARGLPLEKTAELLGIDPSTLWRKRKRYGL